MLTLVMVIAPKSECEVRLHIGQIEMEPSQLLQEEEQAQKQKLSGQELANGTPGKVQSGMVRKEAVAGQRLGTLKRSLPLNEEEKTRLQKHLLEVGRLDQARIGIAPTKMYRNSLRHATEHCEDPFTRSTEILFDSRVSCGYRE
jgi:hypothetical protein